MKNCLDNNWKATWIVCSLMLTVAAVGGFALVRGQDVRDPARPVEDSPYADLELKPDSVPDSKQPSEPLTAVLAGHPGAIVYPALPQPDYRVQPVNPYAAEISLKYQQLLTEIASLVKQYRETKDEAKQREIRDRIQALTDEQFDLRQKGRELEVERLKQRVVEVEGSVQKRKVLKDKIVARRVEDLLTGPNELQWESTQQPSRSFYSRPVPTRPAKDVSSSPVGPPGSPAPSYQDSVNILPDARSEFDPEGKSEIHTEPRIITRYVPRQVTEHVPGPNGTLQQVTRTVYEAERVNVPITVVESDLRRMYGGTPSTSPSSAAGPNSPGTPSYYPNLASGATVAEAVTRLKIAERKLSTTKGLQFYSELDKNEHRSKMADLEGDVDLAKLQLAQAKRSYEAARQLIDLELRRATVALQAAQTELEEAQAVNKRIENSIPPATIRLKEKTVEGAKLDVERAQAWADFYRDSAQAGDDENATEQVDSRLESEQPDAKNPAD